MLLFKTIVLLMIIIIVITVIAPVYLYLRKIRNKLCDCEKRFKLLEKYGRDIIFRYRYIPERGFEYISPALFSITGYMPEEFYGNQDLIQRVVHPDDRRQSDILNQQQDPNKKLLKIRLIGKDGESINTEQQHVPIYNSDGDVEAIEGVVRDITGHKKMEDELVRLDQLRLIGEMAATIAHEVKNPLTTAQGFLQILERKDKYISNKKYLGIILDELKRANTIIDDYLLLGREKNGKLVVQQLNDIIKSLYPLIKTSARASSKRVVLELENIPEIPLVEKEIRQLLLNLTKNGLEAMSEGGKLTIMSYMDNGTVVLGVKDQGKGIEPGVYKKLGEPFFTTKEGGTGLGLAVCNNIAERHGAAITVKTGPIGTVFSVGFKLD